MQENVSLEEFEQEARSFLDAHASRRPESRTLVWGEGTDSVSLFDERTPERERNELAQAREWRATTFDAGFGWITGPRRYGGRRATERVRPAVVVPGVAVPGPAPGLLRHRPGHGGADDPRPRHRRR